MVDSNAENIGKGKGKGKGGADLDRLLAETSRTFALSIPVLPDPTRREVTVAYLLFRIADTFEDASHWTVAARTDALARFSGLLEKPSQAEARLLAHEWTAARPSSHTTCCPSCRSQSGRPTRSSRSRSPRRCSPPHRLTLHRPTARTCSRS